MRLTSWHDKISPSHITERERQTQASRVAVLSLTHQHSDSGEAKKRHHGLSDGHRVWEELQTNSSKVPFSVSSPTNNHINKRLWWGVVGLLTKTVTLKITSVFTLWTWTWRSIIRYLELVIDVVFRMSSNTLLHAYYLSETVAAMTDRAPTANRLLNKEKSSLAR